MTSGQDSRGEPISREAADVEAGDRVCETVGPDESPTRVDAWVTARLSGVTRAAVQRWIGAGRVLVDGRPCRAKDKLRPGVRVEIFPDREPATDAKPDPSVDFEVVHEDEHLLVVDKPAGLVVHPAKGNWTGTLVNGLLARAGFERAAADPRDPDAHLRPGIVHRIDKETSGLLVVAKTPAAREGLKSQLAEHTVERSYLAITVGVPRSGTIETLHARDPRSRLRYSSRVESGKQAVTRVDVLEQLASSRAALVACTLSTGRTHQIRVHLSGECKTPILADALYGGFRGPEDVVAVAHSLGRQALHAGVLGFTHPMTQQRMRFEVPIPPDLALALECLRDASARV